MSLSPGHQVGPYIIDRVIGRGGFSIVLAAHHVELGTRHALKCVFVKNVQRRQRALLAASLQASLRHPSIVASTDLLESRFGVVVVFDLVDGPSLDQALTRNLLSTGERDVIACAMLNAVSWLHGNDIVHRDIKAANVLLEWKLGDLQAQLTDFGEARSLTGPYNTLETIPGVVAGTPASMAPERRTPGCPPQPAQDVFSLGCMLYRLYCGRPAFDAADDDTLVGLQRREHFIPPDEQAPALERAKAAAITAALRADPRARVPDGSTLRAVFHGDLDPAPWLRGYHREWVNSAETTLPVGDPDVPWTDPTSDETRPL